MEVTNGRQFEVEFATKMADSLRLSGAVMTESPKENAIREGNAKQIGNNFSIGRRSL
jgi:hypothetical protein